MQILAFSFLAGFMSFETLNGLTFLHGFQSVILFAAMGSRLGHESLQKSII